MNTPKTSSVEDNLQYKFIKQTSQKYPLITILLFSLIIIIWWWIKHRQHRLRNHGTNLFLCGITNSGKTLLFNSLTLNKNKINSNSLSINHGIMTLDYLSTDRPIKKVHVIDIPGHLRTFQHDLYVYKTSIKGIIFVIDSTTIEKDLKNICDYLEKILCDKYIQDQHLPVLIFCNKQDISKKNQNVKFIRQLIENELTRRYPINRKNSSCPYRRLKKKFFQYNDIKKIRIEFAEGSVLNTHDYKSNLLRVHQWIARIWFK